MREPAIPNNLANLIEKNGKHESHSAHQIFHAQSFNDSLFLLSKGYVKRYQVTKEDQKVIELIYGPGHIFPLSQLYRKYFGIEQNQHDLVYVYQTMEDIELYSLAVESVMEGLEKDPTLYIDLWFESGLRLKTNIDRLASNSLRDDYKKVAHQLVCLADEFSKEVTFNGESARQIQVPLEVVDMAEQLNISTAITEAIMANLSSNNLIRVDGKLITILDTALLKDVYL